MKITRRVEAVHGREKETIGGEKERAGTGRETEINERERGPSTKTRNI